MWRALELYTETLWRGLAKMIIEMAWGRVPNCLSERIRHKAGGGSEEYFDNRPRETMSTALAWGADQAGRSVAKAL